MAVIRVLICCWEFFERWRGWFNKDLRQLYRALPHGPRVLWLDSAQLDETGNTCRGVWKYRGTGWFCDHFPVSSGLPRICPGWALEEMMRLTAACIVCLQRAPGQPRVNFLFRAAKDVFFRKEVMPGTTVLAVARFISVKRGLYEAEVMLYLKAEYDADSKAKLIGYQKVYGFVQNPEAMIKVSLIEPIPVGE